MRWLLVCAFACSGSARPQSIGSTQPLSNTARTCAEAATGLERATKGLRPPESTILEPARRQCEDTAWPTSARECFTTMAEGELGKCSRMLAEPQRDALFAVLGGGGDRTKIAIARAKLEALEVGVAECDQFVAAVYGVLACERMPIETRAKLGAETADFWDLPTHGLSADAQQRMAAACGTSLSSLQQLASNAGCQL